MSQNSKCQKYRDCLSSGKFRLWNKSKQSGIMAQAKIVYLGENKGCGIHIVDADSF